MINGKLAWLILVQFLIVKGCYCLNSTQKTTEAVALLNTIFSDLPASDTKITTPSPESAKDKDDFSSISIQKTTVKEPTSNNSVNANQTQLEITRIFHGDSNSTMNITVTTQKITVNYTKVKNCLNVSSENMTCVDQSWNDTSKTNYSTIAEAVGSSEDIPAFRLSNSAAIAAGVFLISAVLGYISCVGYRRFLQRKYGNSQILIGEEVYDTTDLRNFEI